MTLLNDADKIYLGATEADAVYLGATKIWPSVFDPTSIAGLTMWLDASTLSAAPGAMISAWPDISGNGRTVNIIGTPALIISPILKNANKVVRFTLGQARVRATGLDVDKDYTLVYVARMWGSSAGRIASASYPPANVLFGWWNGFEGAAYAGGFLLPDTKVAQTTNWKMYSADAATLPAYRPRLFSNGVFLTGDGTVATTDGWGANFNLSGYTASTSDETCDCEVAEVVLYNRKLSDADRQQVEDYLRTKWGF